MDTIREQLIKFEEIYDGAYFLKLYVVSKKRVWDARYGAFPIASRIAKWGFSRC